MSEKMKLLLCSGNKSLTTGASALLTIPSLIVESNNATSMSENFYITDVCCYGLNDGNDEGFSFQIKETGHSKGVFGFGKSFTPISIFGSGIPLLKGHAYVIELKNYTAGTETYSIQIYGYVDR